MRQTLRSLRDHLSYLVDIVSPPVGTPASVSTGTDAKRVILTPEHVDGTMFAARGVFKEILNYF